MAAVDAKKHIGGKQRGALVSVDKRVIAGDPERVSRGEDVRVGLPVVVQIDRTNQRRLQEARVPEPRRPAMLHELGVMDGFDHRAQQPNRLLHFASSRSAFRYWPMPSRAARICASNAGSYGVIRIEPSGDSVK